MEGLVHVRSVLCTSLNIRHLDCKEERVYSHMYPQTSHKLFSQHIHTLLQSLTPPFYPSSIPPHKYMYLRTPLSSFPPLPLLPSHIYPLTLLPSPLTYTPTYVPLAVERGSFPLALTLLSRTPSLTCCQPLSLETQVYMDRTHVHTVQYVEEEEPTLLVS